MPDRIESGARRDGGGPGTARGNDARTASFTNNSRSLLRLPEGWHSAASAERPLHAAAQRTAGEIDVVGHVVGMLQEGGAQERLRGDTKSTAHAHFRLGTRVSEGRRALHSPHAGTRLPLVSGFESRAQEGAEAADGANRDIVGGVDLVAGLGKHGRAAHAQLAGARVVPGG